LEVMRLDRVERRPLDNPDPIDAYQAGRAAASMRGREYGALDQG
jgi:hypothetical protein